jgi:signal transduction histidine kinase/DNA-binding response OmpR family regulator
VADYNSYNGMNGNNIYDVFVDNERIWMSNYPVGVTLLNNQFSSYKWIRHSIGNEQSLVNNQVNYILQDRSGDVWYATNNGISLYHPSTGQWESFLSMTGSKDVTNHIFLTLCEVSPGVIWAAGYGYTIHEIRKDTRSIRALSPSDYGAFDLLPDKYIRTLITDSKGLIWAGGYYNLKELDYNKKRLRLYPGLNGITDLAEKCPNSLWVGTATGLYLLDKASGAYRNIQLPTESFYVTALYQDAQGTLYIGTNSSGLLIYHPDKGTFKHRYTDNSGLISNCINSILEDGYGNLVLGTDHGLTNYNPATNTFRNWTKEQGLKIEHFNPQAGVLLKDGNFLFGSTDGAINFSRDMKLPTHYQLELLFSEFRLFYRTIYPGDKGSPLTTSINETRTLQLNHDQNIFSLDLSCVNYDYPSLPLYTWKMEGFYDQWSPPNSETRLRFNNLTPGKYLLRVRAVSAEDRSVILRERSMEVIINPPFWQTFWAWVFYLLLLGAVTYTIIRFVAMRRIRQESDEKIQFFINTAHDIRTPLTLIKAPLEEVEDRNEIPVEDAENIRIALRNVNALLRLTTNLINFERVDTYSDTLYTSEYELSTYMNEVIQTTEAYANNRHVTLTYRKEFTLLNVLIDKDKMDSILKNILSNALKYTPEGGSVDVLASDTEHHWSVEVTDTGIGIPLSEQRKLFRTHFRGSNAINSKVTGSGIGLLLVWKLVHLHKGKIIFRSTEGEGTYVKVIFPKDGKQYKHAVHRARQEQVPTTYSEAGVPRIIPPLSPLKSADAPTASQSKILVVEDNDDLREYLLNSLSDTYTVQVCENGRKALELIRLGLPDLVISDVMMPEMRGDELCGILKNDIETSHIPIILLTALSTDKDIINGLHTGADEYIVKPFNIGILRATIANLITNRALLKQKYARPGAEEEVDENDCINCGELDRRFLTTVRKHIEDHLDSPTFTVDTLCGLLYMSRTSFYNKMKALTDQAPADYIRLVRLNRAAQMLREQKHNIAEIALLTGFSDAKYFREVFKKHYRQTPSQYAKHEEPEEPLPNEA